MEHKYTLAERKQTYSVHFQNTPSAEQVLYIYRNALNDFIKKSTKLASKRFNKY